MSYLYRFSLSVLVALSASSAFLASAQAMSPADKWDEIKEDYDLATPVRPKESLAELYYRLETRLSPEQRQEISEINRNSKYQAARALAPVIKIKNQMMTFSEAGKTLTLSVSEENGNFVIRVNDRVLTEEESLSPKKAFAVVQKLLDGSQKVSFWFLPLILPEARADLSLGLGLGLVAVVGVLGYLIYKKTKSSSTEACKSQAATCCNVSGKPVAISNSCCADIGGFNTGVPVCPASFYDQSAVLSQQIRATSAGQ